MIELANLERMILHASPATLELVSVALQSYAQDLRGAKLAAMQRTKVTLNAPRKGRDRGQWRFRVRGPGVDTAELSGIDYAPETRAEAEAAARRREQELNGEVAVDEGRRTFGEVFEAYCADVARRRKAGTAKRSRCAWRWAREAGIAQRRDGELSTALVELALDDMFYELKGITARGYYQIWTRAWRWGRKRGLVEQRWPEDVSQRALTPADKTQKRALSQLEVDDLLAHSKRYGRGRYRSIMHALATTAARVGELLAADVEDLEQLELGRPGILRLLHTKTSEPRIVPLEPELVALLHAELGGRRQGPIWTSARGARMPRESLYGAMVAWRAQAGLEGQVDLHSLRRYAIVRMEKRGVPRAAGREVSGHKSSVVYDSYADKGAYDVLEAAKALWLGQSSPLSPGTDRVSIATPDLTELMGHRPRFLTAQRLLGGAALADRRVPACPLLLGVLLSSSGGLGHAAEALRQALEVAAME